MEDELWLAQRFEGHREHLRGVAFRMLGSLTEADDAVQETWLRLSRSDTTAVDNLGGWLTTVTARICLDMLRTRKSRREDSLDWHEAQLALGGDAGAGAADPEREAILADSVGIALLVVLERLSPAERLAFVLHDLFAVPYDEIARIVGRSPEAAKMLASRGRRRIREAGTVRQDELTPQQHVVEAFLAASRQGDFQGLLALLDPDVVLRADEAAVRTGADREVIGADSVAQTFSGRARAAQPALINGTAGLVWVAGGRPRVVFDFTVVRGRIVGIELLADPDHIDSLDLVLLT